MTKASLKPLYCAVSQMNRVMHMIQRTADRITKEGDGHDSLSACGDDSLGKVKGASLGAGFGFSIETVQRGSLGAGVGCSLGMEAGSLSGDGVGATTLQSNM
jgi:hypothetical protein